MIGTTLLLLPFLAAGAPDRVEARPHARPLRYTTSWVGNTFGGGPRWVQNAAESMQVLPDGSLLVGSFWDEGGREVGLYKNGDVVGRLPDTHMRAGFAVAASERYFFYAHTCGLENQPEAKAGETLQAKPICYFGVSRYTRDGKHAPFHGGKTRFQNMVAFREAPDNHALIPRGVAASDEVLFVADTAFDTIKVIDPETMKSIGEFPAPKPGRLAIDPAGNLWAICGGKRVASYSADGKLGLEALSLPAGAVPEGLGFDRDGRLLVCDNGPRQQVHAFDIKQTPPKLVESFGEEGGMFAGPEPGKAGPWRFAGPTGAGCDAAGNLYVSCNVPRGGTVLRAFSPGRELLWELLGLEFVDVADADTASDGRDVLTVDERYRFDPDASPGKDWRWEAHTLDPFRYPHDLRRRFPGLQCGTSVRSLGGKRFLCQRGMWQGLLGIYRIEGDLAVPSVVLSSGPIKTDDGWSPPGQPESGRWLWRDADGDGQMVAGEYVGTTGPDGEYWASNVDSAGDIWQAGRESGIWRWQFRGLDEHGNPRYDPKPEHAAMPAPFTDLLRTEYVPATDTMYLSGQTKDRPISHGEWGTAGTVIVRYDDWSKTPKRRYRIDLPYVADKQFIVSVAYAGELAFAVDCKSAEIFVYNLRDGSALGSMRPGPEVHGESGWVDFRDGIRAVRRKDGGYLVFVEEDYKGKSLVYRLEDPLEATK
jgi:sugar lactone lactonase YvrE